MGNGLGELEQVVLLAVLRLADRAYGVSIREEIASCTGRRVTPGALYTTLDRLEKKGALASQEGEPTPERGGRAKRFYTVTETGRTQVVQAQQAFRKLMAGSALLEELHG